MTGAGRKTGSTERGAMDSDPAIPMTDPALPEAAGGQLARNVVAFARLLRAAGLPVGPDRTVDAVRALEAVGVTRRDEVHAALSATLIGSVAHQPLFDAAFELFWRDPRARQPGSPASGPDDGPAPADAQAPMSARLADALAALRERGAPPPRPDAPGGAVGLAWSERERLARRDFDSMDATEFEAALRWARELPLPIDPVPSRRHRPSRRGAIDLRGTLRRAARDPGLLGVAHRSRRERPAPLALLIDVSGSMRRYARVLLHVAHVLVQRRPRVAVFTFGTRLTEVTRALRRRDPDLALAAAARAVPDWDGGTRIGPSLDTFNRRWARRVLGGGGAAVLVTDGLDRAEDDRLGEAAACLSRFARPLLWLNPLLRWEGFEPRAAGVRALLPHVDRHLPVHSLDSIATLAAELRAIGHRRAPPRRGPRAGPTTPSASSSR
jgi:uncharacterized protein with von Willebrand factor type A (vWA) domain